LHQRRLRALPIIGVDALQPVGMSFLGLLRAQPVKA
jgi:hypothetical protein